MKSGMRGRSKTNNRGSSGFFIGIFGGVADFAINSYFCAFSMSLFWCGTADTENAPWAVGVAGADYCDRSKLRRFFAISAESCAC